MDWTGGTRRRFATGKNNAVLQKQKAHFAKARAAQQNPRSSQHSFKPDFLQDTLRRDADVDQAHKVHVKQTHEQSRRKGGSRPRSGHSHNSRPASTNGANRHDTDYSKGSKRHRFEQSSPSVVYISSRGESSSPASVTSRHNAEKARTQHQESAASQRHGMDEEERLLLAKRRKLLARTDWLGLNMQRPINISFRSSGDKDRIGKRRKVKSSASRKGRPAAPRMLTPLFQGPLSPGDHAMGVPLRSDDIRIKIGTDALASQTLPSRRSHTPGRTSVRHPSTEFGPLSEESMLLGAGEEAFPSELFRGQGIDDVQTDIPDNRSTMVIAGSQIPQAAQIAPEVAEMRNINSAPDSAMRHEHSGYESQYAVAIEPRKVLVAQEHMTATHAVPETSNSRVEPSRRSDDRQAPRTRTEYYVRYQQPPGPPEIPLEESDDGDEMWRKFLEVSQAASTHHSTAALRSSSMHVDTSESDCHPRGGDKPSARTTAIASPTMLTRKSVEGPVVPKVKMVAVQETLESGSTVLQSPSASLKQITKLAEQPAIQSRQDQEDARDEALWKEFFVGSQDSSDDVPQPGDTTFAGDTVEDIEPIQSSSALTVSGLGTSVKSTIGDTLFITTDTSSRVSEQVHKRERGRKSEQSRNQDTLTLGTSNSRPSLQTATVEEEEDEIEDVELPPKRSARANIHAGTTNILNHRRFKPPVKKASAPERRPSRFCASRRTKTFVEADRSVYDLVDSDGISLA